MHNRHLLSRPRRAAKRFPVIWFFIGAAIVVVGVLVWWVTRKPAATLPAPTPGNTPGNGIDVPYMPPPPDDNPGVEPSTPTPFVFIPPPVIPGVAGLHKIETNRGMLNIGVSTRFNNRYRIANYASVGGNVRYLINQNARSNGGKNWCSDLSTLWLSEGRPYTIQAWDVNLGAQTFEWRNGGISNGQSTFIFNP